MLRKLLALAVLLLAIGLLSLAQDGPAISNQHDGLEDFSSVINNPTLIEEPTLISVNGRYIEVPPGWSYTGMPEVGGLPPFVNRWEEPGYAFNWGWINGEAGFAQDGIQLYGNQRYAVQVDYTTILTYGTPDLPFIASNFQVYARLYTANGGMQELPRQNMRGLEEAHSIEWVIESTENPYPFVRLEVFFAVEWPIFNGSVNLQRIDIVVVPDDYRPEAVISFE
jgi:hypothetical protein